MGTVTALFPVARPAGAAAFLLAGTSGTARVAEAVGLALAIRAQAPQTLRVHAVRPAAKQLTLW